MLRAKLAAKRIFKNVRKRTSASGSDAASAAADAASASADAASASADAAFEEMERGMTSEIDDDDDLIDINARVVNMRTSTTFRGSRTSSCTCRICIEESGTSSSDDDESNKGEWIEMATYSGTGVTLIKRPRSKPKPKPSDIDEVGEDALVYFARENSRPININNTLPVYRKAYGSGGSREYLPDWDNNELSFSNIPTGSPPLRHVVGFENLSLQSLDEASPWGKDEQGYNMSPPPNSMKNSKRSFDLAKDYPDAVQTVKKDERKPIIIVIDTIDELEKEAMADLDRPPRDWFFGVDV